MTTQLEQLLTCCICLDRFRNPKLLPCQHSVCMEPCMEGLVDYVRRQVKCPECRAEHRIPYNGVQGFPTNVTLQRFLEAHIEITGEAPDPYTGQFMERCSVCNEKNYLTTCAHCDKKVCSDCKAAHQEILKREIGRINNQVKRAAHRLADQLTVVERNISALKNNTASVNEELENITKRLQKCVRDRCDFLRSEVESYFNTELRYLTMLKEGLEQEITNVESNTDLVEKHMDDHTPWDDCELMDTKDIFLRTMEFIRAFDYESGDYNRRVKFTAPDDLNKLVTTLSQMGELSILQAKSSMEGFGTGSSGQGLSKSKSDHRLAVQFREQEEGYGFGLGRRFGERPQGHDSHDTFEESGRRRFRSRFMRRGEDEEERTVRFSEDDSSKTRPRVIDTEDVSRGPLSGITRMYDSPRVIKRIQEKDQILKKKKEEAAKPAAQSTPKPTPLTTAPPKKTSRQISEDEIDKIKKQNKVAESTGASSSTATSPTSGSVTTSRPAGERLQSLKEGDRQSRADRSSTSPRSATHSPSTNYDEEPSRRREYTGSKTEYSAANGTSTPSRKTSIDTGVNPAQKSYPFSRSSSTSSVGDGTKSSGNRSPKPLDTNSLERKLSRSDSVESNKSAESTTSPKKNTGAAFSTEELKNRFSKPSSTSKSSGSSRFHSRFLGRAGTPSIDASKESGNEEEEEEESSEDSDTEESEETSEEEEEKEDKNQYGRSENSSKLGRSAQPASNTKAYSSYGSSNDSGYGSRYGSTSDNSTSSTRYSGATNSHETSGYRRPSLLENNKKENDDFDTKYPYASKFLSRTRATVNATSEEDNKPTFQSRFLNRSKSSAILGPDSVNATDDDSHPTHSTAAMGSGRARFEELKEKRARLAKSRSSAGVEEDDNATTTNDTSTTTTTTTTTPYRSRYGQNTDTTPSTSSPRTSSAGATGGSEETGSSSTQLSNWARYLKNKYGSKPSGVTGSGTTTGASGLSSITGAGSSGAASSLLRSGTTPSSRALARSRSSHILGLAKEGESSEDDSKNVYATPTSPPAGTLAHTPFGSLHRSQYLQKQRLILKIGSRGSEAGNFTWPRGIAVGPDDSIVVADSSNHRVQVFDQNGNFIKDFGSYGSGHGEFDCLAGVAVNRIGQYIIADRYNHRIQIFDPSGMFLRAFGSQGSSDGKFSYPWGVTTDSLGFIYVCDKENHRIQVFQSDGTFVGKFGSMGKKPGQMEHPHYIAVSSTNKVIVSDSNNHRIQIFDVNGKVMTTFGSEGSEEGQFKFPRGVAVDEQGYIFVADSGNNRIQIFHPDGAFLRCFGCWGTGDGEFKGLEGVSVMSNGNILVCDRENHRVQIF